jgi:hypothetical protein
MLVGVRKTDDAGNMFEWLEKELSEVKTPRFHLVEGPADAQLRDAVDRSDLALPPSYKEFVLKFGNSKLYRRAKNDSYRIGVYAGPKREVLSDGSELFRIGFHDGAKVYFRPSNSTSESQILELESSGLEKVADDFADWLKASCTQARKSYGKEKWAELIRGPSPFDAEEEGIVEARRQFGWRVLGVDSQGNHIIRVTNSSKLNLPALTLGVRSKDGRLNGAILLPVGNISPGQTIELHIDCYRDFLKPHEVEVFSLPDPRPEDRDRYHEFDSHTS